MFLPIVGHGLFKLQVSCAAVYLHNVILFLKIKYKSKLAGCELTIRVSSFQTAFNACGSNKTVADLC